RNSPRRAECPADARSESAGVFHGKRRGAPPVRRFRHHRQRPVGQTISRSMTMQTVIDFFVNFPWALFLVQTVNGIVTGMILALVASGLTLIFGIMDVVNFAHGELFMMGAYIGVVVLAATGSFWLALIIAILIVALLGAALQVVALRPLL